MVADPYLDAGMRGFIANTARKELWRVPSWYSVDDLVSEGYVCFYKCRQKYVGKVCYNRNGGKCRFLPEKAPDAAALRHMMALVSRSFQNRIFDLAKECSRVPEKAVSQFFSSDDPLSDGDAWDRLAPPEPELGTLATLLSQAPAELVDLMKLLMKDVSGYKRHRVGRRLLRETTVARATRLLGRDATDLVARLKVHLGV